MWVLPCGTEHWRLSTSGSSAAGSSVGPTHLWGFACWLCPLCCEDPFLLGRHCAAGWELGWWHKRNCSQHPWRWNGQLSPWLSSCCQHLPAAHSWESLEKSKCECLLCAEVRWAPRALLEVLQWNMEKKTATFLTCACFGSWLVQLAACSRCWEADGGGAGGVCWDVCCWTPGHEALLTEHNLCACWASPSGLKDVVFAYWKYQASFCYVSCMCILYTCSEPVSLKKQTHSLVHGVISGSLHNNMHIANLELGSSQATESLSS